MQASIIYFVLDESRIENFKFMKIIGVEGVLVVVI